MARNTNGTKEMRMDPAKLQGMREPLTVRVEKIRNNTRQPIEVPGQGDGVAPGTNWTREAVMSLENWILTEWTGGGLYHFTVVDNDGVTMEWTGAWDPRTFPERVSPLQAAAAAPATAPATATPQAQASMAAAVPAAAANTLPAFGQAANWLPSGNPFGAAPPIMPANMTAAPPPGGPGPQWGGAWAPPPPVIAPPMVIDPWGRPVQPPAGMGTSPSFGRRHATDDDDRPVSRRRFGGGDDDEVRRIREQAEAERHRLEGELRKMELDRKEAEYKAAIERQASEHARVLAEMKEEIRRSNESRGMTEADEARKLREEQARLDREREREEQNRRFAALEALITKSVERSATPAEDPRMRQLEEELRRNREEGNRTRELAEREAQRLRDEQQRERERWERVQHDNAIQAQMKAQEERTAQLLREATANRQDPFLIMMQEQSRAQQENSRIQAENMREIARMQTSAQQQMAQLMVSPVQVAQMLKDGNQGSDMMMKNIVGSFSGIFDTFRHAVEQITQLSGGGGEPPAVRLLQEGVGRASELAEKYIGMKAAQSQADAHVKAAQADADARVKQAAMAAQAHAAAAAAQARGGTAARQAPQGAQRQPQQPNGKKNGANNAAPQQGSGLNGAPQPQPQPQQAAPAPAQPGKPNKQPQPPISNYDEGQQDPVTGQTIAKVIPMQKPNEAEMFGIAHTSVLRLRAGVKMFLDNLRAPESERKFDEQGDPVGLDPSKTVDSILQGVNYLKAHNLVFPPAFQLFEQGQFADLVDRLIPEATQPYRDECVRILTEEVDINPTAGAQQAAPTAPTAEDGGDDDQDDDSDENEEQE